MPLGSMIDGKCGAEAALLNRIAWNEMVHFLIGSDLDDHVR